MGEASQGSGFEQPKSITRRQFLKRSADVAIGMVIGTGATLASEEGPSVIEALKAHVRKFLKKDSQTATSTDNFEQPVVPDTSHSIETEEHSSDLTEKTLNFLFNKFSLEQRKHTMKEVEEQIKLYIKHGGKGKRLENAKLNSQILNQVVDQLELKKLFNLSDEEIEAYKGILYIETDSPEDYISAANAVGPAQLTTLGAQDGASYLENMGLDIKTKLEIDPEKLKDFDSLKSLTNEKNIVLGFSLYIRLLRYFKDPSLAALAYNAGIFSVDQARAQDNIKNVSDLYSNPQSLARMNERLQSIEAKRFFISMVAAISILNSTDQSLPNQS